jgi:hypothetical protein
MKGRKMDESYEDWHKRMEKERRDNFRKILQLAEKMCPIEYARLVYTIYINFGLPYHQNTKRGVYNKELDSLIGIGKLKLNGTIVETVKQKPEN